MNDKIRFPCYTTRTGLRIGEHFEAPPRWDAMNEDELFWQRVFMPTGSRLERLLPRPEVLWKWAAIISWIVVAFVLSIAPPAHAQFISGNTLLERMNGNGAERAYAGGYVAGVHDAYRGEWGCTPAAATLGQVHDVVKLFLERNPQFRDKNADLIIAAALESTWPCPKKKGSNL